MRIELGTNVGIQLTPEFIGIWKPAFVLLLTLPMLYEKYEDQVDAMAEMALKELKKQYAVVDAKVLSKMPSIKEKKLK